MSTKVYKCGQKFSIKSDKKHNVLPEKRSITVRFLNIPYGEVEVKENGKGTLFDTRENKCLRVSFTMDTSKEYTVTVKYEKPSELSLVRQHVLRVLQYCEGENEGERARLRRAVEGCDSKREAAALIRGSDMHRTVKSYMLELI